MVDIALAALQCNVMIISWLCLQKKVPFKQALYCEVQLIDLRKRICVPRKFVSGTHQFSLFEPMKEFS